jgi:hypothetical protein
MPRGELAKQVSCAKQTMIEELKYLAFQQNSLEKKLEELQSVFITNI